MTDDNFHVGLKLSLEVNKSEERLEMSLAGWIKGAFVIAAGPSLRNAELTSNDDCIVRFLKEGVAFGFQTSMLLKQQYPLPIVFFKYPEEIISMPFRKSARVQTNIRAKLLIQHGEKEIIADDVTIIDLSEAGCMLKMPCSKYKEIEFSTDFYLTFKIMDKSIQVDCSVRGVRKKSENYHMGSEFINPDQATQEILKSFVSMFASVNEALSIP